MPYGFDPNDEAQLSELFGDAWGEDDCKAPTPISINGLAIELMPVEAGIDADQDGEILTMQPWSTGRQIFK